MKARGVVGSLVERRRFETELDDELRFHLEMETRKNVERGMGGDEAHFTAERREWLSL